MTDVYRPLGLKKKKEEELWVFWVEVVSHIWICLITAPPSGRLGSFSFEAHAYHFQLLVQVSNSLQLTPIWVNVAGKKIIIMNWQKQWGSSHLGLEPWKQ